MGGLHGGGVGDAHNDAVGSGFDVFNRAVFRQKMVGASGIGYCGVDGIVQVIGLVATWFATWSQGVWNLWLFSICVFTNRFVRPPTPSGVDEVHLLLASAFRIGDGCGVYASNFFEEAIGTGMLVGDVEAERPTVVVVSGEASLGTWRS
jgi:hypothetical protein